jgi:DNA-binding transcriptional LysR family regulator
VDLRQLRSFVSVVECGSVSRAAELLRISQPSLSIQVRGLEDELGVDLLVRHPRGVTPTDIGLVFCDHARNILRDVDHARDAIRSQVSSPVGRVSLGLPTSACRGLSVPLLSAMKQRYPNISVHVVEGMTGTLDEWIQLGRLDVALLYNHRAYEHMAWNEVITEELQLHVPRGSRLARRKSIPFRELAHLPLVLPGRPNVLRALIEQIASRIDIRLTAADCDSLPAIRQLVLAGSPTIMPPFAMAEEIGRGEMVAIPITAPKPTWELSIVVSQRTVHARASRIVAEVMASVITDLVKRRTWRARLSGPA